MIERFFDISRKYSIELTFERSLFITNISDVLLFPIFEGGVVMTRHPVRGYELPGGKVEKNEMAIMAAIREMWEETGGILAGLYQIGQYSFEMEERNVTKAIYVAWVSHFEPLPENFETLGYKIIPLDQNVNQPEFSPFVKDEVFPRVVDYVRKHVLTFGNR